jgi:hypothetical protein
MSMARAFSERAKHLYSATASSIAGQAGSEPGRSAEMRGGDVNAPELIRARLRLRGCVMAAVELYEEDTLLLPRTAAAASHPEQDEGEAAAPKVRIVLGRLHIGPTRPCARMAGSRR